MSFSSLDDLEYKCKISIGASLCRWFSANDGRIPANGGNRLDRERGVSTQDGPATWFDELIELCVPVRYFSTGCLRLVSPLWGSLCSLDISFPRVAPVG